MDQKRILYYAALIAILFALWQAWQKDYPTVEPLVTTTASSVNPNLPPVGAQAQAAGQLTGLPAAPVTTPSTIKPAADHKFVTVATDVFRAKIDTQGGNIVQIDLLKYPQSLDGNQQPVTLLNNDPATLYIAQSGLIGQAGPDSEQEQAVYTSASTQYLLIAGQKSLDVALTWQGKGDLKVTKIFTFRAGQYDVPVRYHIENKSSQPWMGQFYAQLRQLPPANNSSIFGLHTYQGGSIASTGTPDKVSWSNMEKHNLDKGMLGGWLAMQQRYFLSAWIAQPSQTNRYYSRVENVITPSGELAHIYALGFVGPVIQVPAGESAATGATLYAGPAIATALKPLAPHLDQIIDYGWLWPISVVIFAVMKWIHQWIGNWGWSIVLVTLLIKLLFIKLSATSYRSMAKMRKLTPQMKAIKERYGDDRQKAGQATMELYKKEKVNPLSGCLPMIVQIPFFIALYYVLIESVELRQSPFIFWIHDLSIRDPYFVLPLLMGISMFLQQRLNPPPPDPMQAKLFMLMPIFFTVLFATFPAGLVLYWLVNNCVGALQQWYILKKTN